MNWIVKRIQEDDYGCEERQENEKVTVIVTLVDECGQERQIRVEDDWLYEKGICEGDTWPTYRAGQKEKVLNPPLIPVVCQGKLSLSSGGEDVKIK